MPDIAASGINARPLRVLQIGMEWFTEGSAGGLARVFTDLFQALPPFGIDLTGLVSGPPDVEKLTAGRVRTFCAAGDPLARRLLQARSAARDILRTQRFDAAVCHFALYAAPMLDHLRGLPIVFHFQGPWADEAAQEGEGAPVVTAKRWIERLVYRRAQRMIVLSRAFGDLAVHRYGIHPERIRVIPPSVAVDRFAVATTRSQSRAALGWPTDRPILLTVRRLAARMGIDTLLEAMPSIRHAVPEVLLMIAGTGPIAARLRAQAEALGLGEAVRFLGFLPEADLPLAYRAADLNVLPTRALEGFGLSAAEALAAGTPSMVTPVGGLPEVVAELSPDLVFRSSTAEDMADALVAALRGSMALPDSAQCRQYAADRFGPALFGRRTAAVYREVV